MRRKRDIIIELTSLLDVIMIMIFMVMTENGKLITEKQSSLDSANRENKKLTQKADKLEADLGEALAKLDEGSYEELLERLQIAESKLEGYEFMNGVVTVINIELENKYSNAVRCLTFGTGSSGSETRVCEIRSAKDRDDAVNRLRVYVSEHISGVTEKTDSPIVYMVFTYNPSKVYQDDYAAVADALSDAEMRANNGNVRYRLNRVTT